VGENQLKEPIFIFYFIFFQFFNIPRVAIAIGYKANLTKKNFQNPSILWLKRGLGFQPLPSVFGGYWLRVGPSP
jgi:hypothetical protein